MGDKNPFDGELTAEQLTLIAAAQALRTAQLKSQASLDRVRRLQIAEEKRQQPLYEEPPECLPRIREPEPSEPTIRSRKKQECPELTQMGKDLEGWTGEKIWAGVTGAFWGLVWILTLFDLGVGNLIVLTILCAACWAVSYKLPVIYSGNYPGSGGGCV